MLYNQIIMKLKTHLNFNRKLAILMSNISFITLNINLKAVILFYGIFH